MSTSSKELAQLKVPTNTELNTDLLSFEELQAQLTSDDVFIGSPYTLLNKDKDALVGKPFIIRRFIFVAKPRPDNPNELNDVAIVHVVAKDNERYVMTDGSTGIRDQLLAIEDRRTVENHPTPNANILCANGLTRSDYPAKQRDDGTIRPAGTTYFIA